MARLLYGAQLPPAWTPPSGPLVPPYVTLTPEQMLFLAWRVRGVTFSWAANWYNGSGSLTHVGAGNFDHDIGAANGAASELDLLRDDYVIGATITAVGGPTASGTGTCYWLPSAPRPVGGGVTWPAAVESGIAPPRIVLSWTGGSADSAALGVVWNVVPVGSGGRAQYRWDMGSIAQGVVAFGTIVPTLFWQYQGVTPIYDAHSGAQLQDPANPFP